jgi:proteasome beta subunit
MQAPTVIKLGWRPGLPVDTAIDLTLRALLEAADEDSATGGPDMLRRIFPVVATISVDGFQRVPDEDLERRYQEMFDEIAVERGPSTSETPESLS